MPARPARGTRVALLGFGHVGSAVAARLDGHGVAGLALTQIFDRHAVDKRRRYRQVAPDAGWTDDIEAILSSDADVIVEVLGGVEPARGFIHAALLRGKSVVTANKQVVARHGRELLALASRQGRQLRFEAAVGGAMPIIAAIREALTGDRITRIDAVLNGTTTFVLSSVERNGCTIADAVADAQARGLAEADPAVDIDGDDAAAKLAILCGVAFGVDVSPDGIQKHSIAALTLADVREPRQRDCAVRQVASATYDFDRGTLSASVGPRELRRSAFLAQADGANNAAVLHCERAGDIGLFGCGAGGDATAVAIISDLLAIARDPSAVVPPPRWTRPLTVTDCGAAGQAGRLKPSPTPQPEGRLKPSPTPQPEGRLKPSPTPQPEDRLKLSPTKNSCVAEAV